MLAVVSAVAFPAGLLRTAPFLCLDVDDLAVPLDFAAGLPRFESPLPSLTLLAFAFALGDGVVKESSTAWAALRA